MARLKIAAAALSGIALFGMGAGSVVRRSLAAQPPDRPDSPAATVSAKRAPTVLLDCFGDDLPQGARARMGTLRLRHDHPVASALYTPHGLLVTSVAERGAILVWDAATGRKLREIGNPATRFLGFALSTDGNTLATIAHPGGLRSWDLATGREQRRWHEAGNEVCYRLALSPDGRTVAVGVYRFGDATKKEEKFINVWDTAAHTERPQRLGGSWLPLSDLKISPDSKTLAATATDDTEPNAVGEKPEEGSLRLWDLATGKERKPFPVEGCIVQSVAFSPDSKLLAASVTDGSIRLYDLMTGRERVPRLVAEHPREARRPTADGILAPAPPPAPEGPVPVGVPDNGARPNAMACLQFSPDGSILAGGSMGNPASGALAAIYLWDVVGGKELRQFPAQRGGQINSLAFSPDGKTLATAGGGELVVRLWDVAIGNDRFPQQGHRSPVGSLAISPADGTVFTFGTDGTVRRWDPLTGRELGVFARFAGGVGEMAFAPDGKTLLLGTALWCVAERREIRRLPRIEEAKQIPHVGFYCATAFSPDGKETITVGSEGVRIGEVASGKEVRRAVRSIIDSNSPALSSDGRILATGPADGKELKGAIHLWELASGQEVARLEGLEEAEGANGLAYFPNGRFLAACCVRNSTNRRESMIRIWDTASGHEVRRLRGHLAPAWSAAFTADGRSVVSAGADGTALVWDVSELSVRPQAQPLTPEELKARWNELASSDARVAYRASWAVSVPSAVPFLKVQLFATAARAYKGGGIAEGPLGPPSVLRLLRAIAALERVGTPEVRGVLEQLADGESAALVTREARSTLVRLKTQELPTPRGTRTRSS